MFNKILGINKKKDSEAGAPGSRTPGNANDDQRQAALPAAASNSRAPPAPPSSNSSSSRGVVSGGPRSGQPASVASVTNALDKAKLDDSDSDDEGEAGGPAFRAEIDVSTALKHDPKKKISIEDFDLLKVLGQGSFGKVMLVRKKDTQEVFAMKILKKSTLLKRNQLLHTKTERYILQNIRHPFIVALQYAFQTESKLYMVLDFMGGGELFFWLKKERRFKPDRVRLWSMEILLALEDLHRRDIIYRDLKPENILVGLDGHIKLTDFGLAKEAVTGIGPAGGTKTFAGTPEYLAPEILLNKGHGKAVDWWSLGTLMYEMLAGLPPFYDKNVQRMYQKIMHSELKFPPFMPPEAQDCIGKLLIRQVEERLGSKGGGTEIQTHPFFAVLDVNKVLAREYDPGWKPPQDDVIGNFDTEFTTMHVMDTPVTSSMSVTGQEKVAQALQNFTYDGSSIAPRD